MSIQQAYDHWSATYDTDDNLTRDLAYAATREILAGYLPCDSILEIGCGTGKNTAFLSQNGGNVRAVDFSDGMIARARERVQADNVTFSVADITRPWPYPDRSADLIVDCLVLEHIDDLRFIFSEASRCLVGGGCFFVCELHPFKQYQGAKANFLRDAEMVEIPAFVHHISGFLDAAQHSGLALKNLREWWHAEDRDKPPRLASFVFQKPGG
jgi:ubiquinone/menaquinone biosynthesis C-methylase UbiE